VPEPIIAALYKNAHKALKPSTLNLALTLNPGPNPNPRRTQALLLTLTLILILTLFLTLTKALKPGGRLLVLDLMALL